MVSMSVMTPARPTALLFRPCILLPLPQGEEEEVFLLHRIKEHQRSLSYQESPRQVQLQESIVMLG